MGIYLLFRGGGKLLPFVVVVVAVTKSYKMSYLIHNAKIWRTGLKHSENKKQFYNWMMFDSKIGKIMSCGTSDNPPQVAVEKRLDLGGKWVLPGFHDAHIHIHKHGLFLSEHTDVKIPNSIKELQQRLKVLLNDPYNAPEEGDSWLLSYGFEQDPLGRFPTSKDIDEIESTRPVLLYHTSFHVAVVNSMALKLTGIKENTKVEGGEVDLYPEGHELAGKPNGLLKEKAIDIVTKMMSRSKNRIKKCISSAIDECITLGITSMHCLDADIWDEIAEMADEGKLPIQCFFAVFYNDFISTNKPKKCGETRGPMLTCRCVKIFTDGALGSDTAYLSKPYPKKSPDEKDNFGVAYYTQEELIKIVKEVDDQGYQLEIHVIGDKAAELAVIALEKNNITPDKRPIFVHSQILNEDLVKRMAKLGVIASVQPQSVPSDAKWVYEKLVPELRKCIYPWGTLIRNGVTCAGSSDSPCYLPKTLDGIYDAIFQPDCDKGQGSIDLNDKVQKSFQPNECVTFTEAVDMYTSEGARTDFAEDKIGRLEPGYFANFVVLDVPMVDNEIADLSKHPELLKDTKVIETWARGVRLY